MRTTGCLSVVGRIMAYTFVVLGASCATGDTEVAPTIRVRLEGTLLSSNERPVCEAFAMLKNNPHLCAITAGDGRFRIEGLAWEMPDRMLASAAGCAPVEVEVTQPVSAPDGRFVQLAPVRFRKQDPEFTLIEAGAAIKNRGATSLAI